MIRTRSPFSDPEFVKSRIVIPTDYALEAEARRQDEREASMAFVNSEKNAPARGFGYGLLFSFFVLLAIYLGSRY